MDPKEEKERGAGSGRELLLLAVSERTVARTRESLERQASLVSSFVSQSLTNKGFHNGCRHLGRQHNEVKFG